LADHCDRREFPESPRVTDHQGDPLMPEGDDSLSAPMEMIKKLLFMEDADPDHNKVETEYPVGDWDQAAANGKCG
jgi:hypothetical protein